MATALTPEQIKANFPPPRVPSPTRREDWQIGGDQDASGKVQNVFSGQAPAFPNPVTGNQAPTPPIATAAGATATPPTPPVKQAGQTSPENLAAQISQVQGTKPQSTGNDKILSQPICAKGVPNCKQRSMNWPLALVGGIVAVLAIAVLWRFASRVQHTSERVSKSYDIDVMKMDVAELPHCSPSESKTLVTRIDELVASDEATYFADEPTGDDKQVFSTFVAALPAATSAKCLDGTYCLQEFSESQDLRVQIIESIFANDLEYVPGKKAAASDLRAKIFGYFGDSNVRWDNYPELEYDGEDETFTVPTITAGQSQYEYSLEKVLIEPAQNEIVYVAAMKPKNSCTLTIGSNQCACPTATYYLVMEWDEVQGHYKFVRHWVRRQGEVSEIAVTET